MALPLIPFLGGMATASVKDLSGPIIGHGISTFRNQLGWNDVARGRAIMYRQNVDSTAQSNSDNFTPVRLSYDQALHAFNQGRWHMGDNDRAWQKREWERLRSNLKFVGINIDISEQVDNEQPQPGMLGMAAREWARQIELSSAGPPLHNVIHDYYRSHWLEEADRNVSERELNLHLRRASIRRQADRNIILEPFYHYSHVEAYRLKFMGLIDDGGKRSLLRADGCIRKEDQLYMEHLARPLPSFKDFLHWAEQGLWNEHNAELLHLDHGWLDSPIPDFFMRAYGIGVATVELPNEPDGEKDWTKLLYRSTRKVPSLGEAEHLQFRLRPSLANPDVSVIPGVPTWTKGHSVAALIHSGMPKDIAEQIVAASTKPMEMDFIGETISQALEHPSVMRLKHDLFGPGYQWLTDQLLDHGFDERWARLGTEVVVQIARGKAMAERNAKIKTIRQEFRDGVFKAYEQGTITRQDAVEATEHRQFTRNMATRECNNIDQKVIRDVNQIKIEGIKDAYMNGNLPGSQVQQQLMAIVVNPERVIQYMETWQWERTTKAKHLSTGEILAAMKAGLTTPAQAIMQLANLGWRNPDAIAEVALAQHQMQVAGAKQAAAAAARQAAMMQTQAHQAEVAKLKAQKEAQRLAKEQAGVSKLVAKANHKRLLGESKYYADIHQANARYKAAEKKGDQDLMDAEIQKSQVAYQRWLLSQIELITQAPEVANVVGPLQTEPTPNTGQGEGDAFPSSDDDSPPTEPPEQNGGTPPEIEPG
jgi:hypothetical protein